VLDRTPPFAAIAAYVQSLPIHGNRKPRAAKALHRLSLHDRDGQELDFLNVPLKTLQQIMGASRPQVVPDIIEDLGQAVAVEGSLEMDVRQYLRDDLTVGDAYDWVERPKIKVRDPFRTHERTMTLREFEEESSDVTTAQAEIIDRLDALESRLDTWGWGIVDLITKDRSAEDADYDLDEEAA
jgi:hypothetical protein